MSKEIVEIRDAAVIAAEIETIKVQTKRMVLSASVEIGRKLLEAKDLISHGDWTQWLKEKVNYSQSTADNLMRIAKEYGDEQVSLFSGESKSQTFANLTYSQAVALFALPAEDREEFVQENNVEDMTARQLQDAIKAREQAEKEKQDALDAQKKAENQFAGITKLYNQANESKDKLEQALKKSDEDRVSSAVKAADEIKKLRDQLAAAGAAEPAPPSPEELEKLRAGVRAEVEANFKKKEDQLTLEKKTAEERAGEVEKSYKEKLRQLKLDNESILARQQAAEKKLALSAPEAQQVDAYLKVFQQSFFNITAVLQVLERENPEMAKKLKAGIRKVLDGMAGQLKEGA